MTTTAFSQPPAAESFEVSTEVESRQDELTWLYSEVFGAEQTPKAGQAAATQAESKASANNNGHLDDDEIIRLASTSKRSGTKFAALWAGRWNEHFNSQSEADSSVVFTLAFYTKDAAQIDCLFRKSRLMRDKWDEKHGEKTYGRATIDKALAKVTKQYDPSKQSNGSAKRRQRAAHPPCNANLPAIVIDDVQLNDLTDAAVSAIAKANDPPTVFVRGGVPARVVRDENGVPNVESFNRVTMRCRLSAVANFFSLRETGKAGVNPPLALAENILALGRWGFPALAGIASAPILRTDGSVCATPGYDSLSKLIYCPEPGLDLPQIPDLPTVHDVDASTDMLLNLIHDFPFADRASRANALAIPFSLVMRPVTAGHVPMAVFNAPMQGTGKTLLATTLAGIAVGNVAGESVPAKKNDDEWRKKITSILLKASPFVLLDNIPDNSSIDSPALAAVLTAREWSDRILGKNEPRLPARAVWAATGNNLRVTGDMPRRCYTIQLDANAERPWERSGFAIKDLEEYARENRGALLAAVFTIIRAWYARGRPKASVPVIGSFQGWADSIGSVLAFAGIEGFLGNLDQTRVVQDEATQQWSAFFAAWWQVLGGQSVTVESLLRRLLTRSGADAVALPEPLLFHQDKGAGALKRSLGRHLSRLDGRIFDGRKLVSPGDDTHTKVRLWRLAPMDNPANPAVLDSNPATNPAEGNEC